MNITERFGCIIVGRGSLPLVCAEIALKNGHEVRGLVSSDEQIAYWAAERGIPIYAPDRDLHSQLSRKPFDYLFSIGNDFILPGDVLNLPYRLAINFHDAPLPRYAGTQAALGALMNQEQVHGITWHIMRDQVDAGDILIQRPIEVDEDDTAFSLTTKCFEAAITTFAELIDLPSCGLGSATTQEIQKRTFFSRYQRPPAACVLSWNRPATEIAAFIRALDFGSQPNPMGLPKLRIGNDFFIVAQVKLSASLHETPAGTITKIEADSLTISTSCGELVINKLLSIDGQPLALADIVSKYNLKEGYRFSDLDLETTARITSFNATVCRHESFWAGRLADLRPAAIFDSTWNGPLTESIFSRTSIAVPEEVIRLLNDKSSAWEAGDFWIAAIGTFLARLGVGQEFDIGVRQKEAAEWSGLFATLTPLRINVSPEQSFAEAYHSICKEVELAASHRTYVRDIVMRYPVLRSIAQRENSLALPVAVEIVKNFEDKISLSASQFTFVISENEKACFAIYDTESLQEEQVSTILNQFANYLLGIARNPDCRIADLPILSEEESRRILVEWNATATAFPSDCCIHDLFDRQALLTPDSVAVVCRDKHLTYRELEIRSNQLGNYLRKLGVGPDSLVAISVDRSLEMMIGLLGILKAGGAYVPLDPTYPAERLNFMLEDSKAIVLLTQKHLTQKLAPSGATHLFIDADWQVIMQESSEQPDSKVTPANLAYVIYTSGSTGNPKGVMVEHRNVVNFFAGMDQVIGDQTPGAWLAVTSISFDISVLELFWTLARGFKVVLYDSAEITVSKVGQSSSQREIDFSLFYFASNDDNDTTDKYRLLIEGAKFADRNGFSAIWTPERHFHAFGGLYPNPSVASAAIAAVTERVSIRAGSVVAPLHSPIRIAEEWSIVDNISKGRVGISFASGWHDRDFVLAPENYDDRKQVMLRHIDMVRRLWRGESITTPGGAGNDVTVRIFPQPVQPELPFWLTAGGNPETFRLAGEMGANVLTHLLFQKPEDIAERISIYRQAWRNAGHQGAGQVTIMLHTFIGEDLEQVREKVKIPFCNYLKSSVDLIQQVTKGLGVELKEGSLTETDIEAILEHAFDRYFDTSALMGTPESCMQMVNRLKEMGIDEIGCLIDFGIDVESALSDLKYLNELKEKSQPAPDKAAERIPDLIRKHQITHLQCTPSMARMLAADADSLHSLASLDKLLLGGEALPATLAEQLGQLVRGEIINMYGPTETTIWSTTHRIEKSEKTISIGRPIANTEVYVTDSQMKPIPVGKPGELLIGGAGVARGYLNRPELTAERFTPNPFDRSSSSHLYRTGDLVRYLEDGRLEFLGRIDQQVKIRGFRIEIGEIETTLCKDEAVREAAVIAKEDSAGDKRLFAYVIPQQGHSINEFLLRRFLQSHLPEQMIPAAIIALERLPLTPNNKIDRKALAILDVRTKETGLPFVAPQSEMEQCIAQAWRKILGVERVGLRDNFFDIGGDSLLAVQAVSQLREATGRDLKLVELFKHPTVSSLAAFLTGESKDDAAMQESQDRAAARRELRSRRQSVRQGEGARPIVQV